MVRRRGVRKGRRGRGEEREGELKGRRAEKERCVVKDGEETEEKTTEEGEEKKRENGENWRGKERWK